MIRLLIINFIFLILSGCVAVPSNVDDYAKLQNEKFRSNDKYFAVIFEKVNDEALNVGFFTTPNIAAHYVKPQQAKLRIKVPYDPSKSNLVWAAKFNVENIELEKGKTYFGRVSEENWCIKLELIDSNGQAVAETQYSVVSPYLSLNDLKSKYTMAHVRAVAKVASCDAFNRTL
ncbi:hypothetical protein [Shewanella surugensis]|uniref:Lipoprotein n=1 Tax=Shewanella surugensis TaxID=212020 RepID=A0ABT0L9F7_9GAMM|nr:hypothetical protein [Shewanella surugensis]MCL1124303.1 hypothetical protein [Shewanella surugensis]